MMVISIKDLKTLQENYEFISRHYKENADRKNYFLAACKLFNPNVDLKIAIESRPYGGLIGMGNSLLDKYFNRWKILRLHAVIHDAAGYIKEKDSIGPGYLYALSCPINSCFIGHVTGLMFCIYVKLFHQKPFSLLEC